MTQSAEGPHHSDKIILTGNSLTIEEVVTVARGRKRIALLGEPGTTQVVMRVRRSAEWVESTMDEIRRCLEKGVPPRAYYGINTGFGHQAGKAAFKDPDDAKQLSRNLIMSHSVCVGEYFEEEVVRAAMLIRANTLAKGYSGVRVEVINTLINMLNRDVSPAVPKKGSVGASGDLAPLSHLVLVMSRSPSGLDGEQDSGEAFIKKGDSWTLVPGKWAMEQAEIERLVLGAKEGLALNNGATFSAAVAALTLYDAENLVVNAEIALAMSHEAMQGFRDPFLSEVHQARPHPGQGTTARRLLRLMEGSELLASDRDKDPNPEACPPQDSYSQRCAPQVIGAVRDTLRYTRRIVETELNAATDNPLIFPDMPRTYKSVSCGNFHGEPLAFAMDFLGIAVTELGSIAERRIFRLLNAPRCPGETDEDPHALPSCLIREEPSKVGLNSGLLLAQYTAAALVSDCKTLAHPDSVDSIPTSSNKEDHVSMSANAGRHATEIVKNIQNVVAIEMLCAAQALDFRLSNDRQIKIGSGTRKAYKLIRKRISHLATDRVLYHDIREVADLVEKRQIAQLVWEDLEASAKEFLHAEIQALEAEIDFLVKKKHQCERTLSDLAK